MASLSDLKAAAFTGDREAFDRAARELWNEAASERAEVRRRRILEDVVARYLKAKGCSGWGQQYDLSDEGRFRAATQWLADQIEGVQALAKGHPVEGEGR